MRKAKKLLAGFIGGGALTMSAFAAAETPTSLTLVENKCPMATIVISSDAGQVQKFAAQELQEHIRKITGAELPIIDDRAVVGGRRILVGESKLTRELGLTSEGFKPQEYLIQFSPDTLALIGRDSFAPAPPFMKARGGVAQVAGKFGKALSFNAGAVSVDAFDFPDQVGCMDAWIWVPGDPKATGAVFRVDSPEPKSYQIVSLAPKGKIVYSVYTTKVLKGKGEGFSVQSGALPAGWHHVLANHDLKAGKISLYVDGVPQGEAEYSSPTTCKGSTLNIGGVLRVNSWGERIGQSFPGYIAEARVSKVARHPGKAMAGGALTADADTLLLARVAEGGAAAFADGSGAKRNILPPKPFQAQGTSYAVHDFLERCCGVRWYAPCDVGMACPVQPSLVVSGTSVRRAPAFIYRDTEVSALPVTAITWNEPSLNDVALYLCRLRIGGRNMTVNHSFYGYYDRFYKRNPACPELFEGARPEYFAMGNDDYREKHLCYSNPGLVKQLAKDADDFFEGKGAKPGACVGDGDYFALVPMDHYLYCTCPACVRQLEPAKKDLAHFSSGYASDYIFGLVNQVAKEVKKTHPDKFLSALAYYNYASYPEKVALEDNILISLCLACSHIWPSPGAREEDMGVYRRWMEKEKGRRPITLWLYYHQEYLAEAQKYHCFPPFYAHVASEQFKMFASDGVLGMFLCGDGFPVFDKYLLYKLMDDPTLDVDKALDEFFQRFYGSAAAPMRELYAKIEAVYTNPANYPKSPGKTAEEISWGCLGTAERMAEFGKLMETAKSLAVDGQEKQRVALFEKGIWNYMEEGRRMFLAKPKKTAEEKALEAERDKQREMLRARPLPKVKVPLVGAEAKGDPAAVDWSKAVELGTWHTVLGDPASRRISTCLLHDGKYLYLRLAEETEVSRLVSKNVFSGDDWELFFAAERERYPYRQLAISPNGEFKEIGHGEREWASGAKVLSDTSNPKQWTVKIAIPLDKLLPQGVGPGRKVYANFYRQGMRIAKPGEPGKQVDADTNLLAWSPNFTASFHALDRLGELDLE